MYIRLKDELGVLEAAVNLSAGGLSALGSLLAVPRLPGGFSLWFHCASNHVSPAIHHLGAWPMPALAPGLTETVSQSCLALVKSLSDNNLTAIIGRPGSVRLAAVSGLHICRLWRSSWP
ncbi:hypothetical protein ES703_97224 [subsurface metagenome]